MKKYYYILVYITAILLCACKNPADDVNLSSEPLKLEISSSDKGIKIEENKLNAQITLNSEGGDVFVNVDTDGKEWNIDNNNEWISTEPTEAGILISVGENQTADTLNGEFTISIGEDSAKITSKINVKQYSSKGSGIDVENADVVLTAGGKYPITLKINTTNDKWGYETDCEWLKLTKKDFDLTFTADPNTETIDRTTKVYVTLKGQDNTEKKEITVLQKAKSAIASSSNIISLNEDGGSQVFTITSNQESWSYALVENVDWLEVKRTADDIEVKASKNTSLNNRIAYIKISTGSDDNIATHTLIVSQISSDPASLVIKLQYPVGTLKAMLPLWGEVDCIVDWGDGNVERILSGIPSHKYENGGEYYVTINGKMTHLFAAAIENVTQRNFIKEFRRWGKTGLIKMDGAAYKLDGITSLPADTAGSFENVTSFFGAFSECKNLVDISEDLFAHSKKAVNFIDVFAFNNNLENIPATLFRNCTSAISLSGIFQYCDKIASIPTGLFANCSKVIDASYVFNYAGTNTIPSIPEDIFSSMTELQTIECAFSSLGKVTELPANLLKNNTKIENGKFAFEYMPYTEIAEGFLDNCTELKSVVSMFGNSKITSIPAGLFAKCTKIEEFQSTFTRCTELQSIPAGLFDNNLLASDFFNTFSNCSSITAIPAGLFDKNTKVARVASCFLRCSGLETVPAGLFANCSELELASGVFYQCTSLVSIPEDIFPVSSKITTVESLFYGCTKLASVPAGIFTNLPNVQLMSKIFQNCSALTSVPAGIFDMNTEATSFNSTFSGCTKLTTIPVDIFSNNKKVINFGNTFMGCTLLTGSTPYSVIDTQNVYLWDRVNHSAEFVAPTTSAGCFKNASGVDDFATIPATWK